MATEAEKLALRRILATIWDPMIVEVGAHIGEECIMFEELLGLDWVFHHLMVEPDPRNVQKILDNCAMYQICPMRRLIAGAVSDKSGFAEFYFSDNSYDGYHSSGSLLEPTGHLKRAPHVTFPYKGTVMCYTLDELYTRYSLSVIDLAFTDVQGSEAAMIRGGQGFLRNTHYLFMEVETQEMYRGEALRDELLSMLKGWDIVEDFGCNILLQNRGFVPCAKS